MGSKLVLIGAILVLFLFCLFSYSAGAEAQVAVKEGDWIEYSVFTLGNPPEEHDVTWSRMEIMQVQNSEIRVNVTSQAPNGTKSSLIMTLNVATGQIGAWWIIPANLNPGGTFYDDFLKQNITINGQEQLQYAGATRTITNASVPTRIKQWDKATGVFVFSSDELPDYSINVKAYATNLWSPQIIGLDPTFFYAIIIAITFAIAIALTALILMRRKNKQNAPKR